MSSKEGEGDLPTADDDTKSKNVGELTKSVTETENNELGTDLTVDSVAPVATEASQAFTDENIPGENAAGIDDNEMEVENVADTADKGISVHENVMVEIDENSSDTHEDEIQLRWDDDDNAEELLLKSPEETGTSNIRENIDIQVVESRVTNDGKSQDSSSANNFTASPDREIQAVELSKVTGADKSEDTSSTNNSVASQDQDIREVKSSRVLTGDDKSEDASTKNDSVASDKDISNRLLSNTKSADTSSSKNSATSEDLQAVTNRVTSEGKSEDTNMNNSMASPEDTFININTDHAITKPDVMLDIPGLLDMEQDFSPDISLDKEIHSPIDSTDMENRLNKPDSMVIPMEEGLAIKEELDLTVETTPEDKDSNHEGTDKNLSDLLSEVKAEIVETMSAIEESESVCRLEMSEDDLEESIEVQAEENISSDEISCIEEGTSETEIQVVDPDTADDPPQSNLMEAIQNEVRMLADTMSSLEEQELLDSPTTHSKSKEKTDLAKTSKSVTIIPKTNEERKKEISMKVSTLINSIEEEMQLIDAQGPEPEVMDVDVQEVPSEKVRPSNVIPSQDIIPLEDDMPSEDVDIINIAQEEEELQSVPKDKDFQKNEAETVEKTTDTCKCDIEPAPEVEADSNKAEKEEKLGEEEEIALAVKAIEETTEHIEPTPAVTLLHTPDELSEISVVNDEEPSISLVLDDDSVEMDMQVPQTSVDESEISVIQDSDDEDPVIVVHDAENVPSTSGTLDVQATEESIDEENKLMDEKIPDVKEPDCNENMQLLEVPDKIESTQDADVALIDSKSEETKEETEDTEKEVQSSEVTSIYETDDIVLLGTTLQEDTAKVPSEQKETEISDVQKVDVESIEPQPSTSTADEHRVSEVPESQDSLDLLAESTRPMADDDDQEEDDDDEDFYHDESSNLMTAEHSDESNAHPGDEKASDPTQDDISSDNAQFVTEIHETDVHLETEELSDKTSEKELAVDERDMESGTYCNEADDAEREVTAHSQAKLPIEEGETVPDVTEETAEEPKNQEVFNIDSDDETAQNICDVTEPPSTDQQPPPTPPLKDIKCVNPACLHPGGSYFLADAATVAYYDAGRRRALVCEACLKRVRERQEDLMEGIRNLTPLLELDMNTFSQDLVEISDSDSDGEEDADMLVKEKLGEAGAKYVFVEGSRCKGIVGFVEENLEDLINETWQKFDMDSRLADTEMILQMELRTLEKESKEIKSFLDECQATTDRIRNELYASFPQEIKEVPALLIYDTPEQQYCYIQGPPPQQSSMRLPGEAENVQTPSSTQTRLSKRRLEAGTATEMPAKRPAIPLGYTPLEDFNAKVESSGNKANIEMNEKIEDDDNVDVSVVTVISSESAPPGLPPPGEPVKPPLRVGMTVYAMKNSFGSWIRARVLEVMPKGTSPSFTSCRVKFENKYTKTPTLPARCLAYAEPASARMTIGTRVIALFKDTGNEMRRETYYSGIVAEVPNPVNSYRYLIFFDDGYAQYATHADTRLVCECSPLVWEEVHPFSREFVREYLRTYPARPMVRLHPFQSLKTEWNGKWWTSRVAAVDASLAQVHFPVHNRYEWIYRGSTRLAPLYLELQAAGRHRPRAVPRTQAHSRSHMPVVEYTRDDEQPAKADDHKQQRHQLQQQAVELEASRQRAVAKKSTTSPIVYVPVPPLRPPGNSESVTSRVVYYTPKNAVKPHKMVPHTCGPKCKRTDVFSLKELRTYNPLAKPLLSAWERQIIRFRSQKVVAYRAPCGRRIRDVHELHAYLRATGYDLPMDLFDFSPHMHCLAEFVLNKCLIMKKDLSQGKENVPVPCVNYYDQSLPDFCSYNTERTPTAGVPLNLDPEFLCGCDCEDDCEDKTKCACWKLTLEGARTIGLEGDNIGYVYKRLPEPLPSGIYECNSRCKCKHTCLNRVAQFPLQLKLQVFKTLNRGWGIRALNDVPKGAFLCVYAGNLLTDATANLDGLIEGDEYLAELDYIEVVEQMKEGYEEDIPESLKKGNVQQIKKPKEEQEAEESSTEEEEESAKNESEDDDFRPGYIGLGVGQFSKSLRQRKKNKADSASVKEETVKEEPKKEEPRKEEKTSNPEDDCITISDDDEVREPSRLAAAAGMGADEFVSKYRSVRALFGEDEKCYIMDAKVQGNIGRYLNHSCSPNVFVQNVFVDTHDPRFPWVAFFALTYIRAGTELTWNYNYDVGSVPGKALYCYCGASNCRGRLL